MSHVDLLQVFKIKKLACINCFCLWFKHTHQHHNSHIQPDIHETENCCKGESNPPVIEDARSLCQICYSELSRENLNCSWLLDFIIRLAIGQNASRLRTILNMASPTLLMNLSTKYMKITKPSSQITIMIKNT